MKPIVFAVSLLLLAACGQDQPPIESAEAPAAEASSTGFDLRVDRFADVEVLRYQVTGFESFPCRRRNSPIFCHRQRLRGATLFLTRTTATIFAFAGCSPP